MESLSKKFVGSPTTKAYRPTRGNCSGLLYSFKNGEQRPWRGILERDAMMLWDVDPDVESYHVEPIKIPYTMPSGRLSHYTPDRLVHFRGNRRSLLLEIKPARNLRKKRAVWKAKFAAARTEAHRRGWDFDIWTEKQIRGPKLENAAFLRDFLSRADDEDAQCRILEKLAELQETTGDLLLSTLTTDSDERCQMLPQFWKLLAEGNIEAEWTQLITLHSPIKAKSPASTE